MKNNTFKRVLASTLALLTVASPMTANVGGILQEIAIVANAKDAIVVTPTGGTWSYDTLQTGDYFEEASNLHKPSNNTSETFQIVVPTDDFQFCLTGDKNALESALNTLEANIANAQAILNDDTTTFDTENGYLSTLRDAIGVVEESPSGTTRTYARGEVAAITFTAYDKVAEWKISGSKYIQAIIGTNPGDAGNNVKGIDTTASKYNTDQKKALIAVQTAITKVEEAYAGIASDPNPPFSFVTSTNYSGYAIDSNATATDGDSGNDGGNGGNDGGNGGNDGGNGGNDGEGASTATLTFTNVTDLEYVPLNEDKSQARILRITATMTGSDSKQYTKVIDIQPKVTVSNGTLADQFIKVNAVSETEPNKSTYTFTLSNEEAAPGGRTINFDAAAQPYLEKIEFTSNQSGKVLTFTGEYAKEYSSIVAKDRTQVTIVSKAKLGGGLNNYVPTYAGGVFTYTFMAVEGKTTSFTAGPVADNAFTGADVNEIDLNYLAITKSDAPDKNDTTQNKVNAGQADAATITILRPTDEEEKDAYVVPQTTATLDSTKPTVAYGSTVTVISDKPFTIPDGAIDSIDSKGKVTTKDVTGIYTGGAFKATFVASRGTKDENDDTKYTFNIQVSKMPANLAYTNPSTNKVVANATAEDGTKIVDAAEVSSLTATAKVPVYADAEKTVITVDKDNKPVYTETALANNATLAYNKDRNAFVDVAFSFDRNLLGFGGTANASGEQDRFKLIITKNGNDAKKKVVYTYELTKTNDTVQTVDNPDYDQTDENSPKFIPNPRYNVASATKLVGNKTQPEPLTAEDNLKDIITFDSETKLWNLAIRNAGAYNVQLYTWGTDIYASSLVAATSFTVNPATDVKESDIKFRGFYKKDLDTYEDARTAYVSVLTNPEKTATEKAAAKATFDKAIRDIELTVTKNSDGIYEVACEAEKLKATATQTVTIYGELADGTSVEIEGNKTFGVQDVQKTANIVITDDNYDVDPIPFTWVLTEQAVEDQILFDVKDATTFVQIGKKQQTDSFYNEFEKLNAEDGYKAYEAYHTTVGSNTADKGGFIPVKPDNLTANIEAAAKKYLTSTNGVDVSNVTWRYTKDEPIAPGMVDLDAMINGLPNEDLLETDWNIEAHPSVTVSGSTTPVQNQPVMYFIYATCGNFETAVPLQVMVCNIDDLQPVEATLTKTEFTYGERITVDDIGFTLAGTNELVEGLTVKGFGDKTAAANVAFKEVTGTAFNPVTTDAQEAEAKVYYQITKYGKDGKLGATVSNNVDKIELVPGKYQVKIRVTDGALDSQDYDVVTKAEGANTTEKTIDITVKKRKMDASFFNPIEVQIENKIAKLKDNDLNAKYKPTAKFEVLTADDSGTTKQHTENPKVKIEGKFSSATQPGSYTVEIGVVDETSSKWTELYEDTCDVQWRAVESTDSIGFEPVFLAKDADLNTHTNLEDYECDYLHDNIHTNAKGDIMIHADVQLKKFADGFVKNSYPTAETYYGENKNYATTKEFNDLKVAEYGFVYEKAGVLKDLKQEDVDKAEAYLQLGICPSADTFKNTKADVTVAGIDSRVSSVEDYIWVRPYLKLEDGRVGYGEARRLDFETVANKVINPQLEQPALVQKNVNGTDGIYYYAYASKTTKEAMGYRTAAPKAFGVVISRNGNYAKFYGAITEAPEGTAAADRWNVNELNGVKDKLSKGEFVDTTGYGKQKLADFEELQKAYSITVDNRDVQSKAFNSDNYTEDECGTLIRITDSLSRVYVRTYVDYGNGLVVYSDPMSDENASDYLAEFLGLNTEDSLVTKNGETRYYMVASRTETPATLAAHPTVNTLKHVPQVFQAMKYNADDVSAFGLLIARDGSVAKASFDSNKFILDKGYTELRSAKPNKNVIEGANDESTLYDISKVQFGAVTAVKNEVITSCRAFVVYKGIPVYANVNDKTSNTVNQNGDGTLMLDPNPNGQG